MECQSRINPTTTMDIGCKKNQIAESYTVRCTKKRTRIMYPHMQSSSYCSSLCFYFKIYFLFLIPSRYIYLFTSVHTRYCKYTLKFCSRQPSRRVISFSHPLPDHLALLESSFFFSRCIFGTVVSTTQHKF